jgi:hypothetical protein
MTKKLFIEKSGCVLTVSKKSLTESVRLLEDNGGAMIVRGVPATILDEKNLNGRIYSFQEMSKAVAECKQNGIFESRMLTCTADDHPETSFVKPIDASHVVIDSYIKETNGKKVLFNDWLVLDTVNGRNLKALLKDGVGVGTSIRGLGVLNESSLQIEEYQYLGTDVVGQPSAGTYISNKEYNIEVVIESFKSENIKNSNQDMKKLKKESNGQEELLDVNGKNSSEMDKGGEVDVKSPDAEEPETKDSFGEEDEKAKDPEFKDDEEKEMEVKEEADEDSKSDKKDDEEDEEPVISMEEVENPEGEISKDDSNNEKEKSANRDITLPEDGEVNTSATSEPATGNKPAGEADYEDSTKVENTRKKAQNFLVKELTEKSKKDSTKLESAKVIMEELLSTVTRLDKKLKFIVGESLVMVEKIVKENKGVSNTLESTLRTKNKAKKHLITTLEAVDLLSHMLDESLKSSNKKIATESESKNIKYSSLTESKVIQSEYKNNMKAHNAMGWRY